MKNKAIVLFALSIVFITMLSSVHDINSTGAPIGSTGAPGETNCGRAGCHVGENNINTGTGSIQIEIPTSANTYIPGKKYPISISIQQNGIERFGFSFIAINKSHKSSGSLKVIDDTRTQLLEGVNQFEGREYMTYKSLGTNPYSEGRGKWFFEWTAPSVEEGPVTFYVATVSANNDGTDKGDLVYTDSLQLNPLSTGIEKASHKNTLLVYPNPIQQEFALSLTNEKAEQTEIVLMNLQTQEIYQVWKGLSEKGEQQISLKKPVHLSTGIYLVHVKQESKTYTQKVIIQ